GEHDVAGRHGAFSVVMQQLHSSPRYEVDAEEPLRVRRHAAAEYERGHAVRYQAEVAEIEELELGSEDFFVDAVVDDRPTDLVSQQLEPLRCLVATKRLACRHSHYTSSPCEA